MKYKVIKDNNLIDFEREVNFAISSGWKPFGQLVIIASQSYGIMYEYHQTMIKED